jgi:hypothetical protein
MIPLNVPIRLMALVAMPITKIDLAHEAAEFKEICERAAAKGDRAQELLRSCLPDPALVHAMLEDFRKG